MGNIKSPFQDTVVQKYAVKDLVEQYNKSEKTDAPGPLYPP